MKEPRATSILVKADTTGFYRALRGVSQMDLMVARLNIILRSKPKP